MQKKIDTVGQLLRAVRTKRGMSQRAVAETMGITHTHVSKIESGKIQARRGRMAAAVERYLGISSGGLAFLLHDIPDEITVPDDIASYIRMRDAITDCLQ